MLDLLVSFTDSIDDMLPLPHHHKQQSWGWTWSLLVSFALLIMLGAMWYVIDNRYTPSPHQVSSEKELKAAIAHFQQTVKPENPLEEPIFIPTGIFIQSFEFLSAHTVQVSGYIWQKISNNALARKITPGVIFPEAKEEVTLIPAYDLDFGDYRVFGWRFTGASLLQNFDYSTYPFDLHSIWIRMWPKDFYRNVILIPDLKAYDSTKPGDIFGLESDIVKQGFEFQETFFDMPIMKYDTNFGILRDIGQQTSMEFYFNTVIKRELFSAFVIYLLPIFLIWCILFFITMMITPDTKTANNPDLPAVNLFAVIGALVFSAVLLHISFREKFVDQPLAYLEYFYLITYVIIILIAYDIYNIIDKSHEPNLIKRNLLSKKMFWPAVLGVVVVLTALEFFIFPENTIHWYT